VLPRVAGVGFQIYGEYGSVIGNIYNSWYLKSSDVECFSTRDGQYHRPLGEDAHFLRLQVEGFADRVLRGVPTLGADIDDGLAAVRGMVALARSAESGKKVLLSETEGGV
jgi:predicted dehydrogenase